MDGTYGNPLGRSQSPAPGHLPNPASQYQVNIGRTKTRKWVEAKVQSYDGDDWGDDGSSDEHEPPPPMPQPAAAATSARLPSESRRQFSQTTPPAPEPTAPPPQIQNSDAGFASDYTQPRPIFGGDTSVDAQRPQGYSLEDPGSTARNDQISPLPVIPTLAQAQDAIRAGSSSSPQLPNVKRTSVFGADMFATPAAGPSAAENIVGQDKASSASSAPQNSLHDDGTRASEPVQQPAVSTGTTSSAAGFSRPSLPGNWVTETPSIPDQISVEEKVEEKSANENTESSSVNETTVGAGTAELDKTPDSSEVPTSQEPAVSQGLSSAGITGTSEQPASDPSQQRASRDSDVSDIPPTQPLQPRKVEYSPSDYEPQPISRQFTESTVTYSPIKESDALRDEIMRSLGPSRERSADVPQLLPTRQDTQESSYSTDSGDGTGSHSLPRDQDGSLKTVGADGSAAAPLASSSGSPALALNTKSDTKEASPEPVSASRQRFSWEMGKPAAGAPEVKDEPTDAQAAATTHEPAETGVSSPKSDKSDSTARDAHIIEPQASPGLSSPPAQATASQPSHLNAALAAKEKMSLPEPPSPVSAMSEQRDPLRRDSVLGEQPPTVTSPTPPPVANTVPESPPAPNVKQSQPPIMAFKDIMGMPTPGQRIEKYNETRKTFAEMESGLDNWMTQMKSEHPEHADQTSSFYGAGAQAQASGLSVAAAGGAQASQQQPYYQQYLNASSPAVNAPAPNRSRFGSNPVMTQVAASSFGTSSNQIGTKSKEFMQSAGKMGKGLFNKGKSKLRGTGDKESKKTKPSKLKNERRTSWGVNLGIGGGGRMRIDSPVPVASSSAVPQSGPDRQDVSATTTMNRSDTPTSPHPPPQAGHDATTAANATSWSNRPSHDAMRDHNPNMFPGARMGLGTDNRDVSRTAASWQPVKIGRPSMDQVSVESDRQTGRSFSPEPAYNRGPPRAPFAAIPEDSGVAMPSEEHDDVTSKRSSFVGLPPIQRNSTLGPFGFFGDGDTDLRAFLKLDEENDAGKPSVPADNAQPPPLVADVASNDNRPSQDIPSAHDATAIAPAQAATSHSDHQDAPQQQLAGPSRHEEKSLQEQVKPQVHVQPAEQERSENNLQPSLAGRADEDEHFAPQVQSNAVSSNHIHKMLPAGAWNLQESYLTEPLNSVSRNRGLSNASSSRPRPAPEGYDKEMGGADRLESATLEDPQPPSTPPGRQLRPDAPPSSSHRYPSLFPPQRPEQGSPRSPGQGSKVMAQEDYHRYMITPSRNRPNEGKNSSEIPSGMSFMDESPGREKKFSGLRNMGHKLAQVGRDSRSGTPEPRAATPDVRGDEVSESSVALYGKKKRSSLLPGFRHGNSTEISLPLSRETSHNRAVTPDSFARSETAEHHGDKKRWQFSTVAGAVASKSPLKFAQSGGESGAANHVDETAAPPKSEGPGGKLRLANLKMSNLANKFNRATQGHNRKTSGSNPQPPAVPSLAQVPEVKEQSNAVAGVAPQDAPAHPDSPTSIVFPPHPAVGETSQARHKRQVSGGASEAETTAHRPVSRPQAKDEPAPRKPSGGSLSPTHIPGAIATQYATAPPHGPPKSPLPLPPVGAGSSRGVPYEGGRPSKEFENPRASPRTPDFTIAQKTPPPSSFPRPPVDKPSVARQAKFANERYVLDQPPRPAGNRSPGLPQGQNLQPAQSGAAGEDVSRALAASPEPSAQPDAGPSRQQTPARSRTPGTEHIAMMQSPKPSVDLSGGSDQASNLPAQQGGSSDGSPAGKRPGQTGAQGSLWKGLRSRMSEQISNAAPRKHGKAEATSTRILGAIKRGATEQPTAAQGPSQGAAQSQWRPTQTPQQSPPPTQTQFGSLGRVGKQQAPAQQGPGQQQQHAEPQYAQVPIPHGYQPVRAEGAMVPSQYHMGQLPQQQHYYTQQQQQMIPQGYASQQQQWPQDPAGHVQQPVPYQQIQAADAERRASAVYGGGYAKAQPVLASAASSIHDTGAVNGHNQYLQQQQQIHLQSPPSMSDQSSLDRHPSQVSSTSMQTSSSSQAMNGHVPRSGNSPNLGIDVQKAQQDKEANPNDMTPKAVVAPTAAGVNVELEDTEEARKRTIRLESQEDKILADPEDEAPEMSATSYPGQMWNPYGMEFVDWRDE